ncbi:Tim10/DDP family zinc finger-domain-containing protein [Kockovaella imperatae]|uniref:Mitochondrial import inner membrane translocase subunit n=1 Tax=Kockovaella imperatae TaxID=4999 RepID=A0A1Y1UML6_9TREE|nr:Tim10/DDP family zinc finger-domain-containing protein [Kockovaella imperatae]ORX39249.1 Tim10/DDP family zinc finger-domain-containing protein [Kockovaella imperatae]
MSATAGAQVPQAQFDAATQRELQEFIDQEQAKAKMAATVHELTDTCWKKCVTGSISSKFSRNEVSCLENCVDRFLDTSFYILNEVKQQRNQLH